MLFPQAGTTELDILRHADIALYRAKSQGRGTIQFFLPSMQVTVDERLQVERGLRQALDRGDLLLQFQPQLNRAAQVVGAEALLRWRQPGKGVAGPADFIPVAEETGLIHSIGQWALAETCDRLKAWESAVLTGNLVVSVNVSSWQFVRDDFVRQVERQLARSGPIRRDWYSKSPSPPCFTTSKTRCKRCMRCAHWACDCRWTISAPDFRR